MKLSRKTLKIIAIIAMVIDHSTYLFIKQMDLYLVLRTVGRLAAPIMCYFIAEGYKYTKSKLKYGLRLFIFALISQIPYSLTFNASVIDFTEKNIFFTLFLGFTAIYIFENVKIPVLKWTLPIIPVLMSCRSDWLYIGVIWIWIFWVFRDDKAIQMFSFTAASGIFSITRFFAYLSVNKNPIFALVQFGVILAIPLLCLYDGKKETQSKFSKWFFYIFYPLHLLILWFLKYKLKI